MIESIFIIHKTLGKMSFTDKILAPVLGPKLLKNAPCIKGITIPSSHFPAPFPMSHIHHCGMQLQFRHKPLTLVLHRHHWYMQ
uniref:Uncharacterized protein MANES_11G036600 n=1 Tax=Rhizophora mucronata TaxID=61149 RepID=A0A2P2L8R5_RHIMU